jgi:pimeloyl-ACP methyl ester carboxylesterase
MNNKVMKLLKKRRWLWLIGGLLLLIVLWHVITDFYREEDRELRRRLRQSVKETFPRQTAGFSKTFGIFPYNANRETSDSMPEGRDSLVLIHGLDDPGKVWQSLAPRLVGKSFHVWLMRYPNDQPIAESALLFFEALQGLRQRGVERIAIVSHSMGGLVSREMLTSPLIQYHAALKSSQVPEVAKFIMVGTPNHGSQLARFRMFAEMRDHLSRLTRGEAYWLGSILDGAGEAKIDLLPGNRFLTELNARPHPPEVDMLVIAGITSPWSESDIQQWMNELRRKMSDDQQQRVDAFGQYMISMTHGLGDGLVTVDSARLEGVPYRIVNGTHLSMIRNINSGNPRIPPAVPIIVNHLKGPEK